MLRRLNLALAVLPILASMSCGGGSNRVIPPAKDFRIDLTPATISISAGDSSTAKLNVAGLNGFSDSVAIRVSGLPEGVALTPTPPYNVAAGSSQTITITASDSVAPLAVNLAISASSGTLAHNATLPLAISGKKDFGVSVSPGQVVAVPGASSSPLTVSVAAQNGFSNDVSISFSGLPTGASTLPPSPFIVHAGQSQSVSVVMPGSAQVRDSVIRVDATSGSLAHSTQFTMTCRQAATVATSETETMIYLEANGPAGTGRIGLLKRWGAAISEASLNGVNYVNSDDPGREIQTSLWDSNDSYSGYWGYNPIEAGDHDMQGSPVISTVIGPDTLYTKTQPIQWAPENFGGGYGNPVVGDAYIEKWISVVPGYSTVFKVHYKITHFGNDTHTDAPQELPVAYVNPNVNNFVFYAGNAPWTNGTLTSRTMPYSCCVNLHTPEEWSAYADESNVGLALYTPGQFPTTKGFSAGSTNQMTPICAYSWEPGSVLEFDTYILLGPVEQSRTAIYQLHTQVAEATPFKPFGYLDPLNAAVQGTVQIQGWAWALPDVEVIDVYIDETKVGSAAYGTLRQDVADYFPGAPANVGFQYSLDTTKLQNGDHKIVVKVSSVAGKVATFVTRHTTVSN